MLGPLPTFYKVTVAFCTFLAFVGLGVWMTVALPGTGLLSVGTGLGAGFGAVAAFLLLHDSDHPRHDRARVRIRVPRP